MMDAYMRSQARQQGTTLTMDDIRRAKKSIIEVIIVLLIVCTSLEGLLGICVLAALLHWVIHG